jgi:hypothetical protein
MNLFMHSVQLVLADWRNALRISGALYLVYAIPALIISIVFPIPTDPAELMAAGGAVSFWSLVAGLLYFIVLLWLAVAWHRYVLLNEMPSGAIPPFKGDRMLSYFGRSLLIGLVLLCIGIVLMLVTAVLGVVLGPLAILVAIVFYVVMTVVSYRLSPILPAAALGQSLSLREAWAATAGASGAIIVLGIVSVLAVIVIDLPVFLLVNLGSVGRILAQLWSIATGWVFMLVGISIITTIYGHYVEKRPLAA